MDIEKFTAKMQEAIQKASQLALSYKHQVIDIEHVLYVLLNDSSGIFPRVLSKLNKDKNHFIQVLEQRLQQKPTLENIDVNSMRISYSLNDLLAKANNQMTSFKDEYMSVEHVIMALFEINENWIKDLLNQEGMNKKDTKKVILEMRGDHMVDNPNPENTYEVLEKYGRDLTKDVENGKLDPVIGRDDEIRRVIQILSRKTKNNPILIGEPGVGKTAIAQGLAIKIANNNVPAKLLNKEVYLLDMTSVIAGTQFRGQFEARMKGIIDECKEFKNIILVIDEIHNIIGAGDGEHSMNAANILKPSLANGEIQLIGTTTLREYRKYIEKDSALERRFSPIQVDEPTEAETIEILKGIRDKYEAHHNVKITDDAIKSAVTLSKRYIADRFLPDKAIDLVDVTAAHLAAQHPVTDVHAVEREIAEQKAKQEAAVEKEDFETALNAKMRIEELEKKIENHTEDMKVTATVNDVAESVERMTGIPVSQMGSSDIERLKEMNARLKTKVIGQNEAVEAVARAIRRNRAGFDEGNRPIGSFLFVGPTGVGKTELAKQLALDMFGTKDAIIRLDMSEYSDRTAVSKLIGTTAGYVGYDDNSNTLTERVRRNPYSIILLDEIEKADPQVITLLLQVLDDGRLTDGQGNTVNFKNTVIIATSNAGFGYESFTGDEEKDMKIMDRLKPYFRPEFLNRFNAVIEFSHLGKEDLAEIVELMLDEVNQTLAKKDITLTVTDAAKAYLAEEGYDEVMGVRPLRRVIEQQIRDKVTDYHLDHLDVKHLLADLKDGELVIEEATDDSATKA